MQRTCNINMLSWRRSDGVVQDYLSSYGSGMTLVRQPVSFPCSELVFNTINGHDCAYSNHSATTLINNAIYDTATGAYFTLRTFDTAPVPVIAHSDPSPLRQDVANIIQKSLDQYIQDNKNPYISQKVIP